MNATVAHRVEVLHPQGVHRAVQHNPVQVSALGTGAQPHNMRKDAVTPLVRVLVKLSVQLAQGDGLGVDVVSLDLKERGGGRGALSSFSPCSVYR